MTKITYRLTCKVWDEAGEDHLWGTGEGTSIYEAARMAAVALGNQAAELELQRRRRGPAVQALEDFLEGYGDV